MFETNQVNETSVNMGAASSSVARTVTEYGEPFEDEKSRVPEMIPVPGSIDSPDGRPVAVHVRPSPSGSLPTIARLIESFSASLWSPGSVTDGAGGESLARHDAAELKAGTELSLSAGSEGAHLLVVEMAERAGSGRKDL